MSETATVERAPRPEKVAVVEEIVGKLSGAQAVFVSEYRGLTVGQLASIRNALRPSDAEHVVYKNTLAKLAVNEVGLEGLDELLVGPSALTFVKGDVAGAIENFAIEGGAIVNKGLIP